MKFQPGQKWRTRGGDVVEITEIVTHETHPVVGRDNTGSVEDWTHFGSYIADEKDLIELIEPAPQNERETMSDQVAENKRQADVMYAAEYNAEGKCTNIGMRVKLRIHDHFTPTEKPSWNWDNFDYRVIESVVRYANVYDDASCGGHYKSLKELECEPIDRIDRLKITITNGKASVELIGLET